MTVSLFDLPINETLQHEDWLAEAQRLIRERDEELYRSQ